MERKPTPKVDSDRKTVSHHRLRSSCNLRSQSKEASQRVHMVHACQLLAQRFKDASRIAYARFVVDKCVPSVTTTTG